LVGDNKGNLYVADTNANRIRKIALGSGMITTVAGLGTSGTADNVDAQSAQFNAPRGLAFDSTGSFMYIADSGNNRIRKWNLASCSTTDANGFPITPPTGCNLVTTVAGGGSPKTGVGDGGAGLSATLNFPSSVWFDAAGNLYIADQNNGRIRILDPTGQINTVAGASQSRGDGGPATFATFNNPRGLAADSAGNVYVSDTNNQKIRKISSAGIVSTYAGTGNSGNTNFQARSDETTLPVSVAASTGLLNFPGCVAVDQTGTLYIADRVNSKIRKIDAYGNMSNAVSSNSITISRTGVIGGNTPASGNAGDGGPAVLDKVGSLSGAAGQQHLVNPTVSPRPDIVAAGANLGGDGFLSSGSSTNTTGPNCVAADNSGNIYIADTGNNVIRKVDSSGILTTVVGFPIAIQDKNGVNANLGVAGSEGDGGLAVNSQLNAPQGVGVNPAGTFLCVADTGNHAVRMVNLIRLPPYSATNKCAANDFSCSGLASFPQGLPAGSINLVGGIIPDGGSDALPANGWQSRLNGPQGCAVDDALNIYVADTLNNRITLIDASGKMTLIAGGGSAFVSDGKAATTALLAFPVGIATDNKGVVYFTDRMGLIKQLTAVPATASK